MDMRAVPMMGRHRCYPKRVSIRASIGISIRVSIRKFPLRNKDGMSSGGECWKTRCLKEEEVRRAQRLVDELSKGATLNYYS